jgi:hypothetical protein
MFTLIFSVYGLLTLNQLPKGQNMNSQYFCDVVLEETKEALTSIPEKSGIEGMMIHLDNCKVHNSGRTTRQFQDFQVTRLRHLPYFLIFHHVTSGFSDGAKSKCRAMNSTELTKSEVFY